MSAIWTISSDTLEIPGCRVLAFNGDDALQVGYTFDIVFSTAVSAQKAQDFLNNLVKAPLLAFTGKLASGQSFSRHGMASLASWLFSDGDNSVFRLTLRPRSYKLALTAHSRIFLQMPLPQILAKVLKEEGHTQGSDFEGNLRASYASRPYTCQYNESSARFLLRHLERAGAYTYISQKNGKDVLVLADNATPLEKLPLRDDLNWSEDHADETVFFFNRTLAAVPTKVTLRDYSTEQPGTTEKSASDTGHLRGGGEVNLYAGCNIYGEIDTADKSFIVEEAQSAASGLAAIYVRALAARANQAGGGSSIPWLQAGYTATLEGESFQIISVRHMCTMAGDEKEEKIVRRARQAGFVPGTAHGYRNEFTCHPTAVGAYAPEGNTPRPSVQGLVHARIDASGDGQYAELDEHGRYKAMFFFPEKVIHSDADDPSDGNRSIPLRMAQPHTGESSGIHFPLLKGSEVLVAFTDGDPDRPLILAAMPNPERPSVVADKNQQSNMIQTPGGHMIKLTDTDGLANFTMATPAGHQIIMHDEMGKRELRLQSPCGGHYVRIVENS